MKAYTKFLSIFLAITMIASFAGCGNEPVDAENDSLNVENNIEVAVGETTKIELSNENVVFSSNNEAVARVDENGEVTAVSDGEAVITAKIGDKEQTFTVKVSGKSAEALEKELEETKKQLEEALKENSELKDGSSEEKDASKENTKETESKTEKPKTENKESMSAAAKPANEKKTEKAEGKPTSEKKTQQTTSKTETPKTETPKTEPPKTEPAKKEHIPAANATTEGLPEHLHWLLSSDMPWSNQGLIDDGVVPPNFDLELARQEYKEGKGPYRGGETTGAPADWGDSGKSDSSEQETVEGKNEEDLAYKVVELVNKEREKAGLTTLSEDDYLMEVSAMRAKEIAEAFNEGKKGHTRPNGEQDSLMAVPTYSWVMPNLAYQNRTPKDAVAAWMNSSGHKKNILYKNHEIIGAGCYNDNGTYYWVVTMATLDGKYPDFN